MSFYLLALPFLHDLVGWSFGFFLTVGVLVAALHAWNGLRLDFRFSQRAMAHLSLLLGPLGLTLAAGAFLGRYDLLYSHNGVVWGVGFTDVNVRSGLAVVQTLLLLVLTGLVLANVGLRRWQVAVERSAAGWSSRSWWACIPSWSSG